MIDVTTGLKVGSFVSESLAAFHEDRGFFLSYGKLTAREVAGLAIGGGALIVPAGYQLAAYW